MKKILLTIFLTFIAFTTTSFAADPLSVEQAFSVSVQPKDDHTLVAQWKIAPGYHLYRDHIKFNLVNPTTGHLGSVVLPPGIMQQDDVLGKYEVYQHGVVVTVPLQNVSTKTVTLDVHYQGCADAGFCYPPVSKQIVLNLAKVPHVADNSSNGDASSSAASTDATSNAPQDKITALLNNHGWGIILLGFLGFGVLLAFTPCVLPMIPILSGIIVGESDEITTLKAFWLSLTYVLAMALTYACAGVVAGLAGGYVQAFLQNPWVIVAFSGVFVVLAFSLFGFYELRMPDILHHHVTNLSNKHSGGDYVGVAVMGCLSTLIVSPCVTAPLIGALSYIGKTGNAVLGGSALFAMGVGMGIPLLIIGTVGGKFLPKAGVWMDTVKAFFGVLMLGVAVLLLGRVISPQATMFLWASLLVVSAVYMGAFNITPASGIGKLWKGISIILLVYGFLLLIGAGMGNTNPWQPLVFKQAIPVANIPHSGVFKRVKSPEDLQAAIAAAKANKKPVMLDFYADWCLSCQEMDHNTFKDPHLQNTLNQFVLLRSDVTADDDADRALEKKLDVIAPPTIVFFDCNGNEVSSERIVGEVGPKDLLQHMQKIQGNCQVD